MAENQLVMTFGGGLNARRRVSDIEDDECTVGSENFDLDPQFRVLARRKPFDLVATAPNGAVINGFAQLIKQDNSISTLVQAGGNVYEWDGGSVFTLAGTVSTAARLRGNRDQNYTLTEKVIITDLSRTENVKQWDGNNFVDLPHDLGGRLIAKYGRTHNERFFLANVKTSPTPGGALVDTPHVMLASKVSDETVWSESDKPTLAIGLDAPWFLPVPDLRIINGLEGAFGQFLISTERGRLYKLIGSTAFDYELVEFYQGSAVIGEESMVNIGNDVVLGLAGRIESLRATTQFGDVSADDLSIWIASQIKNATGWTLAYDRRLQKVFAKPDNQNAVYVMHKDMLNDPATAGRVSPWSKWMTQHPSGFQTNVMMQLVDPVSMEDRVYFGDSQGRIFVFDGDGGQDGGTADIKVTRRSRLFQPPEGNSFDMRGWIMYRKLFDVTVTLRVLWQGVAIHTQEISLNLPVNEGLVVYNGSGANAGYYGDQRSVYGLGFSGSIHRQDWRAAGHATNWQLEVEIEGDADYQIEEIGVEFTSKST